MLELHWVLVSHEGLTLHAGAGLGPHQLPADQVAAAFGNRTWFSQMLRYGASLAECHPRGQYGLPGRVCGHDNERQRTGLDLPISLPAFPSIRVIPDATQLAIVVSMMEEMTFHTGERSAFANVLATRGTRAAPEAPFIIQHREALIYMLCLASELEHAIMCQYLYSAFSLKQSVDEGLIEGQLESVDRWRQTVAHVATQEMLHLALVQNLLTSIGAAPHLSRPNLPPPGRYPPTVSLTLLPFGEPALRHFMFLERPEGMVLDDVLTPVEASLQKFAESLTTGGAVVAS
jgi:hypothetical protein